MRRNGVVRAVLLTASVAVGGCSSLFGGDFDGYVLKTDGTGGAGSNLGGQGGAGGRSTSSQLDSSVPSDAASRGRDAWAPRTDASTPVKHTPPLDATTVRDASRDAPTGVAKDGATHHDAGAGSDGSAGRHLERGRLWDIDVVTRVARIPVCFTATSHREWDGAARCPGETTGDRACSGDPFSGTSKEALRESFEVLLEDSWARVTNLEFYGFGDCPLEPSRSEVDGADLPGQFMVTFVTGGSDERPLTRTLTGIGKHDFATDIHIDWQGLRDRNPEALRAVYRETGRALGFAYEWIRGDEFEAPAPCPPDLAKDPDVGWLPRPNPLSDFHSVMDRCTEADGTPGISPGDVVGATSVYGTKRHGSLVGYRGRCVDVDGANANPNASVVALPCRGAPNDAWARLPLSPAPRFEAIFSGAHRCLGVSGGAVSGAGSSPIVSEPCDVSEGQRMPTSNLEWRAMGNMCVVATHGTTQLDFCDGSPAQRWNFWDGDPSTPLEWHQIQSASTGECVTMQTFQGDSGELPTLSPCSAADPRQSFEFLTNGFIRFGNWCLDAYGGVPLVGAPVGLWSGCASLENYNGQFYVSGQVTSLGQCLSIAGGAGNSGDGIVVEPCSSVAPVQVWDFYF
jgi:hypothetical protein